jgi:hypothetical protein
MAKWRQIDNRQAPVPESDLHMIISVNMNASVIRSPVRHGIPHFDEQ